MTIALSERNWHELWEESWQNSHSDCSGSSDIILEYPKQLAQGYKRHIQLRNGSSLTLHNYDFPDDIIVIDEQPRKEDCLEFVFNISSNYQRSDGCYVGAGQNYLAGMPMPGGSSKDLAGRRLAVDIHIEPYLLELLMEGQMEALSSELKQIVAGDEELPFLRSQKTTPAMQLALQQILNCPYRGQIRNIYLEGKALELMALQLELTVADYQEPQKPTKLQRDDIERIHHAKEILLRHFDNPPSLLALARQVGLNDRKLKQGFHQVFGTTAFGYLHHYRMEQARSLLRQRQMNVKEVARAVGYASQSRFCDAFKRKFGVTPRSFQQKA